MSLDFFYMEKQHHNASGATWRFSIKRFPNPNCYSKDYRSMVFQAQSICNSLIDRAMIGRSVDIVRFLLRGGPSAPSLVAVLDVSASTGSQTQIVIQKTIAQWFLKPSQYWWIVRWSASDVDVVWFLLRGEPALLTLVKQLEVSASTGSSKPCHSKDYH